MAYTIFPTDGDFDAVPDTLTTVYTNSGTTLRRVECYVNNPTAAAIDLTAKTGTTGSQTLTIEIPAKETILAFTRTVPASTGIVQLNDGGNGLFYALEIVDVA